LNVLERWITAFIIIFVTGTAWYVTLPVAVAGLNVGSNVTEGMGVDEPEVNLSYSILRYLVHLWPVPIVLAVLLWAFLAPREAGSYYA